MRKLILFFVLMPCLLFAQDDLLSELEKNSDETEYAIATFKGTRLVNGHTVETKGAGALEFIFMHRFGPINSGLYELYGLDQAYVRLALDYGITDNFNVSIGRNSVDKTMDGYLKYKVLHQSKGVRNFPLTVTAFGSVAYKTSPKKENVLDGFENVDRLAYISQLLIARKFSSRVSLQVMPTYVHKNAVDQRVEDNDQYALGLGGRIKITKGVAITTEYYYRLDPHENDDIPEDNKQYNSLGFGVDIETGGHVFQLVLTNTRGLTERAFITETTGDFFDGDIHFGFNVTRTFQLKSRRQREE